MDRIVVRKDSYHDSVFLMALSAELQKSPGLDAGHVVLATPANRALLEREGFDGSALAGCTATDLVIALRAGDEVALKRAQTRLEALLVARAAPSGGAGVERPFGLEGGVRTLPAANLALISVPGAYAAHEAQRALDLGLHVMLFSNNVSLDDELALKRCAAERGLLLMGPDCGTALIAGVPLGFANRVRQGPIGLVGASGTGLQEIACQIHRLGGGVSHLLGTGGRDLSAAIGGLAARTAIDLLAADRGTSVIVLCSKPPAAEVAARTLAHLERSGKPAVVIFLGGEPRSSTPGLRVARSLAEAAFLAVALAEGREPGVFPDESADRDLRAIAAGLAPEQRILHGLFCGGTLGGEALLVLRDRIGPILSNLAHGAGSPLAAEHTLTDLGDDEYTQGRPHPMIEPGLRCEHIVRLGSARETAVLLLDLVLGTGSHPDPAGVTAPAIVEARRANPALIPIASVVGTELDAQGLSRQIATLREAGTIVLSSNVAAAAFAARVIAHQEGRR